MGTSILRSLLTTTVKRSRTNENTDAMNCAILAITLLVCSCSAMARPQGSSKSAAAPVIPIVLDERIPLENGNYGFRIETGNGISFQESGASVPSADPVNPLQLEVTGSYTFTHPDGTVHTMNYVAGPQGFVPTSNMIPTPHPIPAFVQEQILFAEEQKRKAAASGKQ